MLRLILAATSLLAGLAGCATVPPTAETQMPWRDSAFGYRADLVTVTQADLFRLDPELLRMVLDPSPEKLGPSQKLKHLMGIVFGPDTKRFAYEAGHSTTASETWRRKRGDCLSLTVLTYAVARTMGMPAQMQEVPTPTMFDRRGEFDFVNQHVNVLFKRAHKTLTEDSEAQDVIVDFEPEFARTKGGRPLSEESIYARFLNNLGTEHLARRDNNRAYAHFKAAIHADPGYAASYANLALVYRKASLAAEAEQLLRRAVALTDLGDVPVYALHRLLESQGRDGEARRYESILQTRRTRDPYHWIDVGVTYLEKGEYRRAIGALEQARDMTGNFREVHAFLALAYWRVGERDRANEELATLASLGGSERGVAKLRKKFNTVQP